MDDDKLQRLLTDLGFPVGRIDGQVGPKTRGAVARFQLAYNLGPRWLLVDAIPGPNTRRAIEQAHEAGRLSAHFTVRELNSNGDGTCYVHRLLLRNLETMRARLGVPIPLRSAYRDPTHNRKVGGATRSQHTDGAAYELQRLSGVSYGPTGARTGRAADLPAGLVTLKRVRDLELWSGIGYRGSGTPWAMHVDIRTSATVSRPALWTY